MEWQPNVSNMWDFYQLYWAPFGELLTDLERVGIYINKKLLQDALPQALADKAAYESIFLEWAESVCPSCKVPQLTLSSLPPYLSTFLPVLPPSTSSTHHLLSSCKPRLRALYYLQILPPFPFSVFPSSCLDFST